MSDRNLFLTVIGMGVATAAAFFVTETRTEGSAMSIGVGGILIFLVPADSTPAPGDQIVFEVFATIATGSDLEIITYQVDMPCTMAGGVSGSVDAFTWAGTGGACTGFAGETICDPGTCIQTVACIAGEFECPGGAACLGPGGVPAPEFTEGRCENLGDCSTVPFADDNRDDYIFGGTGGSLGFFTCDPNMKVAGVGSEFFSAEGQPQTRYLATFIYDVSLNASGTFTLEIFAGVLSDERDVEVPGVVLAGATIVVSSVPCDTQADPDGFCDDDDVCNGLETCDLGSGECIQGSPLDCPDDGLFCTGVETCDSKFGCVSSGDPCTGQGFVCDEERDNCDSGGGPCDSNVDCEDGDPCVRAICDTGSGTCANHPRFYGDLNHDGRKNIIDLICEARVAFQGLTVCSGFEVDEAEVDYAPNDAGCGDGLINIIDVIITARVAFQNLDDICCGISGTLSCAEVTGGAPHCP